jgi:hypothetical protein
VLDCDFMTISGSLTIFVVAVAGAVTGCSSPEKHPPLKGDDNVTTTSGTGGAWDGAPPEPPCRIAPCDGNVVGRWKASIGCIAGTLGGCNIQTTVSLADTIQFNEDGTFCTDFGFFAECDPSCVCDATDTPMLAAGTYVVGGQGTGALTVQDGVAPFDFCVSGDRLEIGFPQTAIPGGVVIYSFFAERDADMSGSCPADAGP